MKKDIINKSEVEFNNINNLIKEKTLNEINKIKNSTVQELEIMKSDATNDSYNTPDKIKSSVIFEINNIPFR